MYELKEGDIVTRKSYNSDILFEIKKIFYNNNCYIAILQGVTLRIEADSPISDLELLRKEYVEKIDIEGIKNLQNENRGRKLIYTGKILHLDGDKKYSEKAIKHYRNIGINAIVKNIPEYKQSLYVVTLLDRYNPDILVITGHERGY